MDAIDEVHTHIESLERAPFLFVGSGMSRRYLKLPDWEGLLKYLASLTTKPFGYFMTAGGGEPGAVATALAEELREPWWSDAAFEDSRKEFGDSLTSREGPLKVEIAKLARAGMNALPTEGDYFAELEAMKSVVVDGIITTNYDPLLESIFPDFRKYVGQDELLFTDPQEVGELYKIHGDAATPETIIVTASDFERFGERNPYLAAKLLAIFIEHPIIFLGYSLKDPDVTAILVSIAKVLTQDNLAKLEGNLLLVEWDPDNKVPVLSRGLITAEGFTIPVRVLQLSSFLELFTMLGSTQRKFSASILRRLKEHVYELVLSNQPADRLFVSDIENADSKDIDVVIGVGMETKLSEQGYRGLSRVDLLHDVLAPASDYNARRIVDETLPSLLRQTGITPVYRYLRESGLLDAKGALAKDAKVDTKISTLVAKGESAFAVPASTLSKANKVLGEVGNDLEGLAARGPGEFLASAPAIPSKKMDVDALGAFLLDNKAAFTGSTTDRANWTRCVGLYDYLKYGLAQ